MSNDQNTHNFDTLTHAQEYLRSGLRVVPVPLGQKAPLIKGWPNLRLNAEDLPKYFSTGPCNIGLLLGEPSKGLIDIDLDAPEACILAAQFLPETQMKSGRTGAPMSHWWFKCSNNLPKTAQFHSPDGMMLVELRSSGLQSIVPPSVHPNRERYEWQSQGEPAIIDGLVLTRAVARLATAALLARHWPNRGSQHECALALAGVLLRGGLDEESSAAIVEAAASTAGDDETKDRVNAVRDTARKLATGEPATGFSTLAEVLRDGNKVGKLLSKWLGLRPPEKQLIVEEARTDESEIIPWPVPLAPDAFHGLAGDIVRTIEPQSESDPAALMFQALIAFGNCIGRTAHFLVEADAHYLNLFLVLVGPTSKARKGTSWGHIKKLYERVEPEWARERMQSGLSSGEGMIWAVRDPITRCQRKDEDEEEDDGAEYENVVIDPGIEDKRLMVLESEFASTLRVLGRDGNTLSALVRQAWDTGELRALTKNSPARATGAHISIIGHITRDELRRYLGSTEAGNGFGNRFLWVCARRQKKLPWGGQLQESDFDFLLQRLSKAIRFARNIGELRPDGEASHVWETVYGDLSEGRPGLLGAVTSRSEAQVLRLACVYALLDLSNAIRTEHLLAALALWQYVEGSARYIFGEALGDPLADELRQVLKERPNGMTRTQVRDHFGRHKPVDAINRALGVLLENGVARRESLETGGRRVEKWWFCAQNRDTKRK